MPCRAGPPIAAPWSGRPSMAPHPAPPSSCVSKCRPQCWLTRHLTLFHVPTTHKMETWKAAREEAGRRNPWPGRESNTLNLCAPVRLRGSAGKEIVTASLSFASKVGFSSPFPAHVAPGLRAGGTRSGCHGEQGSESGPGSSPGRWRMAPRGGAQGAGVGSPPAGLGPGRDHSTAWSAHPGPAQQRRDAGLQPAPRIVRKDRTHIVQ